MTGVGVPTVDGRRDAEGPPGARAVQGDAPRAVTFSDPVALPKEEVWEVCGALALAESMLARLGMVIEARMMASVFERVESRLAR